MNLQNIFSGKAIWIGLVVAFLAVQGITAAGFLSLLHFRSATQWVTHTQQVLLELESVGNSLLNVETGQRGYVLTGAEHYLDPYRESLNSIQQHLRRLDDLTKDNPIRNKQVGALENQVGERLGEIGHVIMLRHTDGLPAARNQVLTHHDKQTMNSVRQTIGQIRDQEQQLLQARSADSTTWALTAGAFSVIIFLVMFVVFGLSLAVVSLALTTHRQAKSPLHSLQINSPSAPSS
jgi:methyl-accepting chemotaxis protein